MQLIQEQSDLEKYSRKLDVDIDNFRDMQRMGAWKQKSQQCQELVNLISQVYRTNKGLRDDIGKVQEKVT
jgi:hypothetical protein